MTGYDASTNALRRKIDAEGGNPMYAYRREAERLREEVATLRAQLAGVRERILQLDRYGSKAPDVVLSRVVLGDVLAALGGV